jgi:hypothetical protein
MIRLNALRRRHAGPPPPAAEPAGSRAWSARTAVLVVAAANLLLAIGLLALRSPARADQALAPPPALPAAVVELQPRIDAGRHGEPFTLDLSDAELTAVAGHALATHPDVPFSSVRVTTAGETVIVDGVTRGLAVNVPVRAVGAVGARDGAPWARVDDVSLGAVGLPGFARDQIVGQVNQSLDFARYDLPITVDEVTPRAGGLIVRGRIE